MTAALKRSEANSSEQPAITPSLVAASRRYEIHDHMSVVALASTASGVLDVWVPVIPETPYQRILDMEVTTPGRWQIHREAEFGNLVFHSRIGLPADAPPCVQIRYVVERAPVPIRLGAALVGPIATPELFSRVLGLEQFVDVSDKTRALAQDIVGTEANVLSQPRLL